jgi:hypothetical protein
VLHGVNNNNIIIIIIIAAINEIVNVINIQSLLAKERNIT